MTVSFIYIFAFRLFGSLFKTRREKYFNLRQDLLKTRWNISYDMYLSVALLCSIFMSIIGLAVAIIIIWFVGTPDIVMDQSIITDAVQGFNQYKNIAIKIIVVIASVVIFGGGTFFTIRYYPALFNSTRKRNIDQMLPYAVHYMSAMSGAGVVPVDVFLSLAKNPIYGEAAVEASYIVRDIKLMGYDLVHGLKTVAATTPSYKLQEFLQGAITIVSSGGDLESFLKLKANQFVVENMREQREFLETLGLIAETYVTAFIAGPLFLIVMVSVMSIMGGSDMIILYLLIYMVIPVSSVMFVILVSSLTPEV
ncbi:MAG: secretion system protein [Candidatus Methanomarinus sp.]|uniref:Secretion system protein n=1 Tax=Candidatus Methanomarinus sp. TaxID=3386244 RepID=A0AC61SAI8_9EURY|nr:MAG: flagellar protein FlaJ [ANME-2 cluster archaeon]TKY91673.1 MAG: secretion system protein [ANME-2 cluster archaeon]